MGRKQKSAVDKAVILLVLLVLAFYLVQNFAPAKGQNTVGLTVRVNYKDGSSKLVSGTDRMLSVVDTGGKSISSVAVSATLYVEFVGNVSEATIQGQLQTRFDGDVKRGTPFSIPQVIVSGQKYDLAVETTLETDINSWATSGTHTLAYTVPSGAVLTLKFTDGNVASKTFSEVSASLTLTVQPSSGITVAEITISPSTSGNATPTPASPTPSGAVVANSGSPQDIQAAVNTASAAGGGTVYVPAGTFNWNGETVNIPAGVSVIGAGQNNTVLQQAVSAPFPVMFSVSGSGQTSKPVRISGITFKGNVTGSDDVDGSAVYVENVIDYRIDHCDFIDFPNMAVFITGNSGCRGVIDHCNFKCLYKDTIGGSWGYGVVVASNNYWDWDDDITHFLGKYETIPTLFPTAYIEDCYFYKTRHAVASNQLGWYVFRYNTVYQDWNSGVDVHGSAPTSAGGRGGEVYNNYINAPTGIGFRGGSGVIFNNTCSQIMVGKDIEGTPLRPLNNLWIWSNSGEFINEDGYYVENVNYFLRAPNLQQDGFTYTPYPYPHPLTLR